MEIELVRADLTHVDEYVRIGKLLVSRLYMVATTPVEAREDISNSVAYMIRVSGRIVGFIGYQWKDGSYAYIDEVAVEPDWQGRGIGRKAFGRILHNNLERARLIDLHTHPENHRAKRLYGSFGFRQVGDLLPNFFNDGEPRIRMALERPHKADQLGRLTRRSFALGRTLG